jgi:hypothetical protein
VGVLLRSKRISEKRHRLMMRCQLKAKRHQSKTHQLKSRRSKERQSKKRLSKKHPWKKRPWKKHLLRRRPWKSRRSKEHQLKSRRSKEHQLRKHPWCRRQEMEDIVSRLTSSLVKSVDSLVRMAGSGSILMRRGASKEPHQTILCFDLHITRCFSRHVV